MASKTTTKKKGGKKASSATKKQSAKQLPLKKERLISRFKREIWGVVCGLLAILVLVSNLDKGSFLSRFFMGLVGKIGVYVLPIGLVLCAVALLFHGNRPVTMRLLCSLGFTVVVIAMSHLAIEDTAFLWNRNLISELYRAGSAVRSGGVIGGLFAMLFSLPGGKPVGWAICIVLLLFTLPASMNLTLTGLLKAINNHRDELRRQEREAEQREEHEVHEHERGAAVPAHDERKAPHVPEPHGAARRHHEKAETRLQPLALSRLVRARRHQPNLLRNGSRRSARRVSNHGVTCQ